jgi:hypothetical protein
VPLLDLGAHLVGPGRACARRAANRRRPAGARAGRALPGAGSAGESAAHWQGSIHARQGRARSSESTRLASARCAKLHDRSVRLSSRAR